MANVCKPTGSAKYVVFYKDADGKRRKKTLTTDKAVSERIARELQNRVALQEEGLVDPKAEAYRDHAARPLADHIAAWVEGMQAKGDKPQHVRQITACVMRIVALIKGARFGDIDAGKSTSRVAAVRAELQKRVAMARIPDLTSENVQRALAIMVDEGRSYQTANNHRTAIKSLAKWLHDTHRVREVILRGVAGFNAKEDPRHERRTVALDELVRLIEAAEHGPVVRGLTGPSRALLYRLAVSTGLRYGELASITPESFNWEAPSVTVAACDTKNGQTATLPLPADLVADLKLHVASLGPGMPAFRLPKDKGSPMIQRDLKAAGIPYRDASGRFFDFHSLRCELATLADAAGVSPRVVQKMMRHSTLELTGRYTRPRVVDIEAAAERLPSLKPTGDRPETLAATGTDPAPVPGPTATCPATLAIADTSNSNAGKGYVETAGDHQAPAGRLLTGDVPWESGQKSRRSRLFRSGGAILATSRSPQMRPRCSLGHSGNLQCRGCAEAVQ